MRYVQIPVQDMRSFLQPVKGWMETISGNEIVFTYNLKSFPFIQIKIFSGIKSSDQTSRDCGKDAIRVCAVNVKQNKGWIKVSRVYRIEGWKANLQNRVMEVIRLSKERINYKSF